jgi:hypothetical protein
MNLCTGNLPRKSGVEYGRTDGGAPANIVYRGGTMIRDSVLRWLVVLIGSVFIIVGC